MKSNTAPLILFVIKLMLGIVFIYSSFHKIEDPAAFARILYGYDIFPRFSINIIAICVPFIELTTGLCLLFGLFPRSAVLIMNVLLALFIVLIAFNLARGHQFDCGCFSSLPTKNQTLLNISSLVRDIFMLTAGIYFLRKTADASTASGRS